MPQTEVIYFVPDGVSVDRPIPVRVLDVADTSLKVGAERVVRTIIFKPEFSIDHVENDQNYAFSFSASADESNLLGKVQAYEYISKMIEVGPKESGHSEYVFNNRRLVYESSDSFSGFLFREEEYAISHLIDCKGV